MTENMAGRGEGLAGLREALKIATKELWHTQVPIAVNAAMPSVIPCVKDCVKCMCERALEAAAPPSTAPLKSEVACVREFIQWAIDHIETDEAAACAEQATDAFDNIFAALATPSPQSPATTIKLSPPNCPSVDGKCPLCGSAVAMCSAGPYCSNKKCTWVDGYAISPLRQHREEDSPEDWARYLDSCKPPAATQEPAGSVQVVTDLQVALRIVGDWKEDSRGLVHVHKDAIRKAIVAALRSAGKFGSPRKVGEDGPAATEIKRWFCQRCQREHSIAMPISGCEPDAAARCIGYPDCDGDLEGEEHSEKCIAARPSSAPVGEQK